MEVYLVEAVDVVLLGLMLPVEYADMLLLRIEVEPGNRATVVVIEENCAVALGIAHSDPCRVDLCARDCLDDGVGVYLVFGGHDAIVWHVFRLLRLGLLRRLCLDSIGTVVCA